MIIVKKGDVNRLLKWKKFVCTHGCGCEVIANQNEYTNISSQHDGPLFSMNCPTCGKYIFNDSDATLCYSPDTNER